MSIYLLLLFSGFFTLHVTILAFCQPAQLNQLVAIWMLICGLPVSIIAPARTLQPKLTKSLSLAAGCVIIFNMVLFISLSISIGCVDTCLLYSVSCNDDVNGIPPTPPRTWKEKAQLAKSCAVQSLAASGISLAVGTQVNKDEFFKHLTKNLSSAAKRKVVLAIPPSLALITSLAATDRAISSDTHERTVIFKTDLALRKNNTFESLPQSHSINTVDTTSLGPDITGSNISIADVISSFE